MANKSDTFDQILQASDCPELMQWLQQQHLMYSDPSGDYHMTHAGIPPILTLQQARQYAEVEQVLRSDQAIDFFTICMATNLRFGTINCKAGSDCG